MSTAPIGEDGNGDTFSSSSRPARVRRSGTRVIGAQAVHGRSPCSTWRFPARRCVTNKSCAILKVNFNIRVRYAGHFPLDHGDELKISVQAVDPDQLAVLHRDEPRGRSSAGAESLRRRPPSRRSFSRSTSRPARCSGSSSTTRSRTRLPRGRISKVSSWPSLARSRRRPAIRNSRHLRRNPAVAVARSLDARNVGAVPATRLKDRPAGQVSEADLRTAAARMDEARAAMRKNNLSGAMQILIKVLAYPENTYSAEAQELLGLARQKSGQLDEARAEYADYLAALSQRRGQRARPPATGGPDNGDGTDAREAASDPGTNRGKAAAEPVCASRRNGVEHLRQCVAVLYPGRQLRHREGPFDRAQSQCRSRRPPRPPRHDAVHARSERHLGQ